MLNVLIAKRYLINKYESVRKSRIKHSDNEWNEAQKERSK